MMLFTSQNWQALKSPLKSFDYEFPIAPHIYKGRPCFTDPTKHYTLLSQKAPKKAGCWITTTLQMNKEMNDIHTGNFVFREGGLIQAIWRAEGKIGPDLEF